MGKIVLLVVIATILALIYFFSTENKVSFLSPITPENKFQNENNTQKNSIDTEINGNEIRIAYIKTRPENISLHTNLIGKRTGKELLTNKSCGVLISAGFYSKNDKHIGLFTSEGEIVSSFEQNKLFNGVFGINNGKAAITKGMLSEVYNTALQSGPVLYSEGVKQKLSLASDAEERRITVMTTTGGNIIFSAFYNKNSVFIGPKLADLPDLVNEFQALAGEEIISAMNLDGGTASAFYSGDVSLGELSPIGGYFCIK